MRLLFLGAGGTGGYFGGRAAQAGADVTFLVREPRARACAPKGCASAARWATPWCGKLATSQTLDGAYDVVVLSCKAYDLASAIEAIRPAVGPDTAVLPIMNGVLQYEVLDREFEARRVLGGLCQINATLGPDGEVVHLGKFASIVFGERAGPARSARCEALAGSSWRRIQQSPERQHPPGRVGKVRIPDHAGGRHLPDARAGGPDRRHRRRRRHPARPAARIAGRGGRVRACGAARGRRLGAEDPDRHQPAHDRVHVPRPEPGLAGRSRPHRRRHGAPRRHVGVDATYLRVAYAHLQVYQAQRAAG